MACKNKIPKTANNQTTGVTAKLSAAHADLLEKVQLAMEKLKKAPLPRNNNRYDYPEACQLIDVIVDNLKELDNFPQGRIQLAHALRHATEYIYRSGREFYMPFGFDAEQIAQLSPQIKSELLPFYLSLEYGLNVSEDYMASARLKKDPILTDCLTALSASPFEDETVAYNVLTSIEKHTEDLDVLYFETLKQLAKNGKANQKLALYLTSETRQTVKVHPENVPYILAYLQREFPTRVPVYLSAIDEALRSYPTPKLVVFLTAFEEDAQKAVADLLGEQFD